MPTYLEWKIDSNAEAGGAQDAIAYKWCHVISEDWTRRALLNQRIDELHQQTYKSQKQEAVQ